MPGDAVHPQALDRVTADLAKALSHPLRVKIMGEVTKRPMSPNHFRLMFGLSIHNVSYHFRQLEKAGCLEVVDEIQRRGAVEHIYAARARAFFDEDVWSEMPKDVRIGVSGRVLKSLLEAVSEAIFAGTFDARTSRHLVWGQEELDESGWDDLQEALAAAFERIGEIREESRERVEDGAETIRTSWALLGFESPNLPGASDL